MKRARVVVPARPADTPRQAERRATAWHGPPLPPRERPRRVWREHVFNRAAGLAAVALWLGSRLDAPSTAAAGWAADADADVALRAHLNSAVDAAEHRSLLPWTRRARLQRALAGLDAAEVLVLRRASAAYLTGQLPGLLAHVQGHLPPSHPERLAVERMVEVRAKAEADGTAPAPFTDADRSTLGTALESASAASRRETIRLRSFRNIVLSTTLALGLLAGGLALLGSRHAEWTPLCFAPQGVETVVCPTNSNELPDVEVEGEPDIPASVAATAEMIEETAQGHDVAVVMLLGLTGAAVTGAAALRHIRGTSTPFAVPTALIALKLPTGALTAFLGLLLINGGFVPGLSALDTSGQILAWAVLFGAAQQLVTGFVDRKAQSVLDSVGTTPMTQEKE